MRVIFAAYRDWALKVLPTVQRHPRVSQVKHVSSIGELELAVTGQYRDMMMTPESGYDLVLLCGWSWQVSERLLSKIPVISEHPCDSDVYSLGTPLQAQILDGVKHTKHRVVKVGYPELIDRQYAHEVDMNLTGNMDDILDEMASTAKTIYTRFLDDWPNIEWKTWDKAAAMKKPRVPADSRLTPQDFEQCTTRELYDHMRCLEAPYPNAYIEDDEGVLYFERVRFKSHK